MPGVLLDLVFAAAMANGGAVAGWWLHRAFGRRGKADDETHMARELLSQLQSIAYRMAANVGRHASRVEEINQELTLTDGRAPEAVVSVVGKLIDANRDMQQHLGKVENRLKEQALLVELKAAEARTDALTGLANRRALDLELGRRMADLQSNGKTFSLLLGDIDHFKQFNDRHGHQAGDEVLRGVARMLKQSARPGDLVARYGGEEFAVVLPETGLAAAIDCVERIRQAVAGGQFRNGGGEFRVTISFGAAEIMPGEEPAALLRRADTALYAAKSAGRNRIAWHDGRMLRGVDGPLPSPEGSAPAAAPAANIPPAHPTPTAPAGAGPQGPTPLCPRHEFDFLLARRLAEWRRGGAAPAVLLARVDQFPELVDRYGREAGELVLRSTRHFFSAAVREMDTAGDYGQATLALLMPGVSGADLTRLADRLREAIARCALPWGGQQIQVTLSAAAVPAAAGDEAAALMRRAQEALAAAVRAGGNRTVSDSGRPAPRAAGSAN